MKVQNLYKVIYKSHSNIKTRYAIAIDMASIIDFYKNTISTHEIEVTGIELIEETILDINRNDK